MKKKIFAVVLCISMLAIAIVGGSLAYFTDTEGAKNVMTVGNVNIVQDETNEEGTAFQDNQKLYPVTGENTEASNTAYYNGNVMSTDQNWISKIVTVYNEGSEDAYVRTLFAFELPVDAEGNVLEYPAADGANLAWRTKHGLHYNISGGPTGSILFPKTAADEYIIYTAADGTKYMVGEYLYMTNGDSMLKGSATTGTVGERSHPSLVSIGLESTVDNAVAARYRDYEILVVSQATQTAGFVDTNGNGAICDDALNTAFGELASADNAKLTEWFANAQ